MGIIIGTFCSKIEVIPTNIWQIANGLQLCTHDIIACLKDSIFFFFLHFLRLGLKQSESAHTGDLDRGVQPSENKAQFMSVILKGGTS